MIRTGAIQIPFRYAAGGAGSRFLAALRDRSQILGSHCAECACVLAPLRAFCPRCGNERLEDVAIGPEGTVLAWTERAGTGTFALIRLDGADTPVLHRLLAATRSGARVRARFGPERRGSILDLVGFEPAGGASA